MQSKILLPQSEQVSTLTITVESCLLNRARDELFAVRLSAAWGPGRPAALSTYVRIPDPDQARARGRIQPCPAGCPCWEQCVRYIAWAVLRVLRYGCALGRKLRANPFPWIVRDGFDGIISLNFLKIVWKVVENHIKNSKYCDAHNTKPIHFWRNPSRSFINQVLQLHFN